MICGRSTWEYEEEDPLRLPQRIVIYLDPRRDGRVRLVLHELLHVYMTSHFCIDRRMVYELEEAAIRGWEETLYAWLHDPKRHKALESWNQAIQRKMR